jgi:hypothetical protein
VITRRREVIIYRRFGTTCLSHLHGSRFHEGKKDADKETWQHSGVVGNLIIPIVFSTFISLVLARTHFHSFRPCPCLRHAFQTSFPIHFAAVQLIVTLNPKPHPTLSFYWLRHIACFHYPAMLPSLLVSVLLSFVESRPVKMGPTHCPETSVNNYLTTPCNHPKDHTLHNYSWLTL